jgi:hypothetical protein
MQHLSRVVPRSQVLLFTRKSLMNEMGRSHGQVQKSLRECLYINLCVIPYSINFFNCEDFTKQKRTLLTLNQQMKELSKWNNPLISHAAKI